MKQELEKLGSPKNCWEIYFTFTLMALQAFGGSMAIAQQVLVDQKKWLTQKEFLELLTVSQVLPGPNVMILTTILGDKYFGWKGALASILGMVSVPGTLMLTVYVIYQQYAQNEIVSAALAGMAASAAGMVGGTALKLVINFVDNPVGKIVWLLLLGASFTLVGLYKISMLFVLPLLGLPAIGWAYCQIAKKEKKELEAKEQLKGKEDS